MCCGWTQSCIYPPTGNTHRGRNILRKLNKHRSWLLTAVAGASSWKFRAISWKKRRSIFINNRCVAHILHVNRFRKVQEQLRQFVWKTFPPSADKCGNSSWEALTILNMKTSDNQQDHPGLTFWFGRNPRDWLPLFPVILRCRMIYGEWQLSESVFWW